MKKRLLLGLAAIGVVSVTMAAYYQVGRADEGPRLITTPVTRGDVVETVQATGTLQAVTTVQVGTQVSGTIKALHADFNSEVKKGQVVAELEPSLFQTQVEQAQATLDRLRSDADRARVSLEDARVKLERADALRSRQLLAETDYETALATAHLAEAALKSAEAQVVQAQASLNQSKVNLGHTIIRAPIDGIVISRSVDVGQTVAASMQAPTLFVIAQDLTRMQVSASIDESDIGRIASGQPVSFRVDAYPGKTFSGLVSQVRLEPVVEQNVVSYATVIDVPNPGLELKPGMTATVTVEVAHDAGVLRVPNAALAFRPTPEVLAAFGGTGPDTGAGAVDRTAVGPRRRVRPGDAAGAADGGDATGGRAKSAAAQVAASGEVASTKAEPGEGAPRRVRGPHVWVLADGRLRPVPVSLGVNDGTTTAVVAGELTENVEVVTGTGAQAGAASANAARSPLMPFGGRRSGGGRPVIRVGGGG